MADQIEILVVDDEVPQMRALCDTLRDHGYATTGFSAGSAALEAMRGRRFDLLLTDLMMPEMDGIVLLQSALGLDPDLVGILMTGAGSIATAVEAMKAGAFDYLLKPFKLSELLPVITRALSVRQLRLENAELHRRMREHTIELEAVNRELEAFSYSVSHDLRAPLRAIDGFSQALLDDPDSSLSADAGDHLQRIRGGVQRMAKLIDALLSLSQVMRAPLRVEPVDLGAIAREVVTTLREAHPTRQVEVIIADGLTVQGDPRLLEVVLTNLIGNAWKFTGKQLQARIEVGFGTPPADMERPVPVYRVRDNGAGFDMSHASKLFGAFQRLHQRSDFEGTGIGLATVQRIIHRHGGRIWAEAAIGAGASFSFTLGSDRGDA